MSLSWEGALIPGNSFGALLASEGSEGQRLPEHLRTGGGRKGPENGKASNDAGL